MFEYLWTKGTNRKRAPIKRRLTPRVELLEDRCLPTTAIAEFPVLTSGASPYGIATGPDGNVWFTENQAGKIGMINPTTHAITEYTIPTSGSEPMGITAGPDGNVWFTEYGLDRIGEINLSTHVISQFAIPTANSGPSGITAGPDGNLWFTEFSAGQIGSINPTTGAVTEYPITTASSAPMGITAGPDGNIWFTESSGNNIGRINPATHAINEFAIPQTGSAPYQIITGADGNIWFTENSGNRIGEFNTSTFAFAKATIPTGSSGPYGITTGAGDNLWFVESSGNQIGDIDMSNGAIAETAVPTDGAAPIEITNGPGGTLWFTESTGNQIGEVVSPAAVTNNPASQTVVNGKSTTFTATATGYPTPTVLWYVSTNGGASFIPLINAGVYSGVTTGTLTITGATQAMNGFQFEAVFTNGVAADPSVTTTPATLTVKSVLSLAPTLPQGIAGTSYNQTLSILGNTTPIDVLSVNNFNAGTTGLTLSDITTSTANGTIAIAGMPSAGTATFTATIADTGGDTLTQNLTITIRAPLSIATPSLPPGTAGSAYSQAITVAGGLLPYTTFNVTSFSAGGTGLTASEIIAHAATGIVNIVGTPSAAGAATFTVNVTDSSGAVVSQNYTITVNPALAITPTLPAGTSGTIYNQTLTVTGGGVPYSSLTVSHFSAGTTGLTSGTITVNPTAATVTIDGTPSAAGTVTFTVNVVDAIGAVLTQAYTITIDPGLAITPSLPQGTAGAIYDHTITITGGATPYATITPSSFNAGSTGLTAADITVNRTAGTIVVNGTPTATGTASFTVYVADSSGSSLTQAYSIVINAAISIGSLSTTQWTAGKAGFTGVMTISGGTAPFTIVSAGLPTGLTAVVSGTTISITGTPTVAGAFAAGSVTVHDAVGASAAKSFSITINPAPTVGNLTVAQWTAEMSGFTGVMTVAGGTGGLTLAASSGVPTGMNLVLNGNKISFTGTPTTVATFAGSVTLHDALGAAVVKTFTIAINAPPTVGNQTTTVWTAAKSGFTDTLAIAGGTGPFVLSAVSGLPTGLTAVISGNAIRITGTPTTAQTFSAGSITVHDAAGASVTKTFSITINPALQITTTSFAPTKIAAMYTASVQAKGGTGAVTFAITAGSLPPGMKISKTGVITGVSRGIGSFTFTITATDSIGATFSERYVLTLSF